MDEPIIDAARFLGITLLLNMILAGSRWLVAPIAGERVVWIQMGVAVVVALIFGLAAYLVHSGVGRGVVTTAVGSVVLLSWLSGLPLWNSWLWGLALCSLFVPMLLIAARPVSRTMLAQTGLMAVFAVLAGLWWLTWTAEVSFDWWRWLLLIGGLFGLLWSWMWHVQKADVQSLYTAVAFIVLLQVSVVSFFLPFSTMVNSAVFAILFGVVCVSSVWPKKQKATPSTE